MHTNTNTLTHNATPICDACWQSLGGTSFPFMLLPENDRPDGCTCAHLESAQDPHVLHEACDEAAIRSLEASLEDDTPEPPTLEALEEARLMLERQGMTLVGPWQPEAFLEGLQAPEYAPDAATVQADRDHEGICEMLLEDAAWEEFLPEGAAWSGAAVTPSPAKPAHDGAVLWTVNAGKLQTEYRLPEPVHTPKVRDTAPMFDTSDDDWQPEDPAMFMAAMELANATYAHPEDQAPNDPQLAAVESYLETTDDWDEYDPAPDADELAELRAKGLDPEFTHIIGAACSV